MGCRGCCTWHFSLHLKSEFSTRGNGASSSVYHGSSSAVLQILSSRIWVVKSHSAQDDCGEGSDERPVPTSDRNPRGASLFYLLLSNREVLLPKAPHIKCGVCYTQMLDNGGLVCKNTFSCVLFAMVSPRVTVMFCP